MKLRSSLCPLCRSGLETTPVRRALSSPYSSNTTYDLLRCKSCGTLATHPPPDEALLAKIYSSNYAYPLHEVVRAEKRIRARGLIDTVSTLADAICDLGCGDGSLLFEAQKRGLVVSGCDVDEQSVRLANNALGALRVEPCSVYDYLLKHDRLPPVVVMSHSLEHLTNPEVILSMILSRLPQEGYLLLALPDCDRGSGKLPGRNWGYWQVPVHTVHFQSSRLPSYMAKQGLSLQSVHFRNFDLLTLGSTVMNVLGIRRNALPTKVSGLARPFLQGLSFLWSLLLHCGASEMVLLLQKENSG